MPGLAPIPVRSVALIMEESPKDSPLAGSRASVEVSTEEAVPTVVAEGTVAEVIGNSFSSLEGNLRYGERNHAHDESDKQDICF